MATSLLSSQPSHLTLPDPPLSSWDEIKFQGIGTFRPQEQSGGLPWSEDEIVVLQQVERCLILTWEQMSDLFPVTVLQTLRLVPELKINGQNKRVVRDIGQSHGKKN